MRPQVKQAWSHFNRWRKRHWPLRALILLIFLAYLALSAPMLPRLVRHATDAILANSEPRVTHAICESHKANAVRRLRNALVAKLDKDDDGALNDSERQAAIALGLDPDQLFAIPFYYDLDEILAAAHRANLVPPSYTGRTIRVEALRLARIETEAIMTPEREKIDALLAWYRVPNYLEWATWRYGLAKFGEFIEYGAFGLIGNPWHWVPFLFTVYLIVLVAGLFFGRWHILTAVIVAILVWLAGLAASRVLLMHSLRYYYYSSWGAWSASLGDLLFILTAAICGARRAARCAEKEKAIKIGRFTLGAVLVCWGLVASIAERFWYAYPISSRYLMSGEVRSELNVLILLAGIGCLTIRSFVAWVRVPSKA